MANLDQAQTSTTQSQGAALGAENFLRFSTSAMLRGGRITKFKGVAASYSPQLGSVAVSAGQGAATGGGSAALTLGMARRLLQWSAAPLALVAGMLPFSAPAFAQAQDECVLDGNGGFICVDNGDPLTIEPSFNGGDDDLRIVIQDGFDVDTSGTGEDGLQAAEFNSVLIRQESGTSTIIGGQSGLDFVGIYGDIDIITGGDVSGLDGDGINLSNEDGGITLDTTAGTVFGYYSGIVTRNQGTGATIITTADVDTGSGEGGTLDGINAVNDTDATDLVIDSSAGSVTGRNNGIYARNNGTGDTSITTADVTGTSDNGISVSNSRTAGSIAIDTSAGAVVGDYRGIDVYSDGAGASVTVVTGDVTGIDGDGIAIREGGEGGDPLLDVTINTVAGNVYGGDDGIDAENRGLGDLSITAANVTGTGGDGITASNAGGTGDLTIDSSAGAVTGEIFGITANNLGTGDLSITTADVTGQSAAGVSAVNNNAAGALVIDSSAGAVTGAYNGVYARNEGNGDTSITTADVTGTRADGIYAYNSDGAGNLTIDSSAGAVEGADNGIHARNFADGQNGTIITADVTGLDRAGIYVMDSGEGTDGADITIDSSAGAVIGNTFGIYLRNDGTGDASITTADVTGTSNDAIRAFSGAGTGNLAIDSSAGAVNGGINGNNGGTGELSITTADVDGGLGNAIFASNGEEGTNLIIDSSAGAVITNGPAVTAFNNGTGDTSVTTADVTSRSTRGIAVRNYANAGNLTIDTSAGAVSGRGSISAINNGTGDTTITTADVTNLSDFSDGIEATNATSAGDLTIDSSAGALTSQSGGISASNDGTGDTTITTGDVSSYGEGDATIAVSNSGENLTLDTTGGRVYAYDASAIVATNSGSGSATITTGDVVSNTGGDALRVVNSGTDVTVNTSAGSVAANGRNSSGIRITNQGTGAATITTADVTGDTAGGEGHGVDIYNGIDAGELILDTSAGAVVGGQNGIRVRHAAIGQNANITTADVTGLAADGIDVNDSGEIGSGADIAIDSTLGTVTGAEDGIEASNSGTGDMSITTANVDGEAGYGINARNSGAGTGDLTIDSTAGSVTGGDVGIGANNYGGGGTTITTADVTGLTGSGIDAYSGEGISGGMTIDSTAGAVSGGYSGIYARLNGYGSLSVTTGDVTGATGYGIFSRLLEVGDAHTIDTTAGTVTGALDGIRANTSGDSAITAETTITTADVIGTNGDGINARITGNSGDLIIDSSAGTVTGGDDGIDASNDGTGATRILTADVTSGDGSGEGGDGIDAYSGFDTTGLEIDASAGSVTGDQSGIRARHYGTGDASITTANVSGQTGTGVYVYTSFDANNVSVDTTAGAVSGENFGVEIIHEGEGDATITTADVTAEDGDGVYVFTGFDSGSLTVDTTAGAVAGGDDGIEVRQYGSGDVSITASDVTAEDGDGVHGYGDFNSGSLTIDATAGAVAGGDDGIEVRHYGYGDVSITAGDVSGGEEGIRARTYYGDLTINSVAGTVSGGTTGILVDNRYQNDQYDVSVVTADVSGSTGDGINVENGYGSGSISINSSAGTVTGGSNGISAYNRGYDQALTIVTANVTGQAGAGIDASDYGENGYGAGDISINSSAGAVAGATDGINADNGAFGDLTITTGDVTGSSGAGISANNRNGSTGDLTIDSSAGVVTGAADGIDATNSGTSAIVITTADVTGESDVGIRTFASNGSVSIDSTAGTVEGGSVGIIGQVRDIGDILINAGDVTGGEDGIITTNGRGGDTTITAANVTGEDDVGISANVINGALTIETTGTVDGGRAGIIARLSSLVEGDITGDLTINSAGAVTSGRTGISANNFGTGSTSITTADVTGISEIGIEASGRGTDLIINTSAGAVTGGETGIEASNSGTGDTSIVTGDVIGSDEYGIVASNGADSSDLTIDTSAGAVSGASDGINAENNGTGDTSITTANVTGGDVGVLVEVGDIAGDVNVDTSQGSVVGGVTGVTVRKDDDGSGDVTVTTADVATTQEESIGVVAYGGDGNVTIDTTAGTVSSGAFGVGGVGFGGGDLSITTADVSTSSSIGGYEGSAVIGLSLGGDIIIDTTAGSVDASNDGVTGQTYYGSVSITTATVDATAGSGITATANNGDIAIDSTAGAVSAGLSGIEILHQGTGSVSVATANVTASAEDGINISTGVESTSLGIDTSAGAIVGADRGIFADHQGSDDLTITVGNVTGESAEGILASTTQGSANILVQGGEGVASNVIGATNGIGLTTQGADITVTNLDSVTGQAGDALNLVSNGGNISVSDIGTVTGLGGNGIFASSDAGNITIANVGMVGGITATDGVGIAAYADNGGTIIIGTSGAVAGDAYGTYGYSSGGDGDVTINTANYSVNAAIGIRAVNEGDGSTSVTTANVTGTGGEGIFAATSGTDVTVDTTAGTISGLTDGIVANNYGSGSTTVTAADVTGTTGNGIQASAQLASLTIDTTAGTVSGGMDGINANSYDNGGVSIVTADVTGNAGIGVQVLNTLNDLVIDTAAGTVSGGAGGIFTQQSNAGATDITTADVTSASGNGIDVTAFAAAGDVSVNTAAGIVSGSQNGIIVGNQGPGQTTITTADVTGTNGSGIDATNTGGALTINSVAGSVSGNADGIAALNEGAGDLTITTADVTSTSAAGIFARQSETGADLTIDTLAGTITGNSGINATNRGSGLLSVTTADVTVQAGTAFEVNSGVNGNGIVIDTAAGNVSGGFAGIIARENGNGAVSITTGNVTATGNNGIYARNFAGTDLEIDSSGGTVTSGGTGINATTFGQGSLAITTGNVVSGGDGVRAEAGISVDDVQINTSAGAVNSGGDGVQLTSQHAGASAIVTADVTSAAVGINAATSGGVGLAIDSTAGTVLGAEDGIQVSNAGSLAIVTADVEGTAGSGIEVVNAGGDVSIDTTAGSVTGNSFGIFAQQQGNDDITLLVNEVSGAVGIDTLAIGGATHITLSSTAIVTGTSGFGIDARSSGGAVTIQGSSGSVMGATDGIYVRPTTGDITISSIDNVVGLGGDGLDLVTQGGSISVSDIGNINGAAGNGITANTDGAGTVNIDLGGATQGALNGIAVATAGGAVAITNSGTLTGGEFAVFAIEEATGPITLTNTGTLSSAIQFGGADDQLLNSGTFTAIGVSDFGEGTDSLVNTGTLNVGPNARFDRLEEFRSSGAIDLSNGVIGDAFAISGNFAGENGMIALDINLDQNAADVITIAGAATGTTQLALNVVGGEVSLRDEVLLVDAGAGTSADAFVLSPEFEPQTAFVAFELGFDAENNDFLVSTNLNARVFTSTKIAEATQSLWYQSVDAWSDRSKSSSDQGPVWVVAYGVSAQRDEVFADPTGLRAGDANLDYSQDYFGIQSGVNYQLGDALTLGVTGGYLNSNFSQDENGVEANFDVLNIGVSASFASGGFFAAALVKYDDIRVTLSDRIQTGFNGELGGSAIGGRIDAGYRVGSESFYAEPRVSFDLQRTKLDDLTNANQSFEFDNLDGARGSAGLRIGGQSKSSAGTTVGYYLDASAVREFDGNADITFSALGDTVEFQNNPIGTYAQVNAGVTLDNQGPLSGFFQVESDLSGDYTSFGAKVGVNLRF